MTHNGRDAGRDAVEEALDLTVYSMQVAMELRDLRAAIERVHQLADEWARIGQDPSSCIDMDAAAEAVNAALGLDESDTTEAETPAVTDAEALRWLRRESLLVLLTRLQRGRTLTSAEADTLRQHVETEISEANTSRDEAQRLGLMVDEYSAGARQLSERLGEARRETETADGIRAETQRDRDQHAAVLAEVLAAFVHKVEGYRIPRRSAEADVVTLEKWRSVVAPTVERPWWEQVDEERTRASVAEMRAERTARTLERVRGLMNRTESGQWIDPMALRFIFDTQDPEPVTVDGTKQPTAKQNRGSCCDCPHEMEI